MVTPVIELSPQLKQRSNQWADLKSYHTYYGVAKTKLFSVRFRISNRNPIGATIFRHQVCADTVGLDADMISKYVKYQKDKERREEQLQFKF